MRIYHEYYHYQELENPRKVGKAWLCHLYQKLGWQVTFSDLTLDQQIKFLNKGFAPAIPIQGTDYNCTSNYLYPSNWNDDSQCPF